MVAHLGLRTHQLLYEKIGNIIAEIFNVNLLLFKVVFFLHLWHNTLENIIILDFEFATLFVRSPSSELPIFSSEFP